VVDKMEIKRKKLRVVEFLLRNLYKEPSQFKLIKIISYFEDMISFSDFRQIFSENQVHRLIVGLLINSRINPILTSNINSLESSINPCKSIFYQCLGLYLEMIMSLHLIWIVPNSQNLPHFWKKDILNCFCLQKSWETGARRRRLQSKPAVRRISTFSNSSSSQLNSQMKVLLGTFQKIFSFMKWNN